MSKFCRVFFLFLFFFCSLYGELRRIGKRHDLSWNSYYQLGTNSGSFAVSDEYPDLSVVGALISSSGALGTATLVAPNFIVTAAHVVKNDFYEIPDPVEWKFYLYYDFGAATSSQIYQIESISIHPAWIQLQTTDNVLGNGDELGVDLAILKLNRSVTGIYPARLPSKNDDPLGLRTVLGGFGTLVEGDSGNRDVSNERLTGGENIIDRSVAKVSKPGVSEDLTGGLLGIDFDSPESQHNVLGSDEIVELLGSGQSQASPLSLEASTAVGDSGGPAFVYTSGYWRIHGVVSYGTKDSSYGDVTVFTRLASHYDWIKQQLPNWSDSKMLDNSGWLENRWLGTFLPLSNGWNFHLDLGWVYTPSAKGNSFWGWCNLLKNWIWLSDEAFPFVYCFTSSQNFWLYILLESSNGLALQTYNYSTLSWETYNDG